MFVKVLVQVPRPYPSPVANLLNLLGRVPVPVLIEQLKGEDATKQHLGEIELQEPLLAELVKPQVEHSSEGGRLLAQGGGVRHTIAWQYWPALW